MAEITAAQDHRDSMAEQSQSADTGTQVATEQADVAQLKRQVRRLKRQLAREQAKNQKQIDEGLQQQINNKRRTHQAEEQVAIAQAEMARMQTANDELTATNHQLQQRVTAMQSYQDARVGGSRNRRYCSSANRDCMKRPCLSASVNAMNRY